MTTGRIVHGIPFLLQEVSTGEEDEVGRSAYRQQCCDDKAEELVVGLGLQVDHADDRQRDRLKRQDHPIGHSCVEHTIPFLEVRKVNNEGHDDAEDVSHEPCSSP
jgi:hypothetical protein